MIKTIIIDDELHCRESLEILISSYCPELNLVAVCSSGMEGIEAIFQHHPRLVFLDIAMPGMDGFEMLEKFDKIDFEVVFTTAIDEYTIKAFQINAIDYLMKPIHRTALVKAVHRINDLVLIKNQKRESDQHILQFLSHLKASNPFNQIPIPTMEGMDMQIVSDILYIKSDGNYSEIFSENEKPKLISKTLKYFELKLEVFPNFCRIHNSIIINMDKMRKYVKGKGGCVVMKDGQMLNVSRQKKLTLFKKIGL